MTVREIGWLEKGMVGSKGEQENAREAGEARYIRSRGGERSQAKLCFMLRRQSWGL